jgi:ammonium transporter, Amt family
MTEIEETATNGSILFNDEEFHKVLDHVRGDYRLAFQEWINAQRKQEFKPHNPGLILAGTILLWVCWLFFNGGSAIIFSERKNGAAKVIMNNLIAPASAALFAAFFKARITGTYSYVEQFDVGTICNGIIVGLVASTASCDGTEPWASVIIGCVAALIYSIGVLLINKFGIDDPLEASPVHLGGGSWGTLVVGLFNQDKGLFYNPSEGIKLLGIQALGLISIIIWVSFWSILLFSTLNRFNLFRVPKEIEIMGLDIAEMGGVNEEIYSKLRTDFGVMSPSMTPSESNLTPMQ